MPLKNEIQFPLLPSSLHLFPAGKSPGSLDGLPVTLCTRITPCTLEFPIPPNSPLPVGLCLPLPQTLTCTFPGGLLTSHLLWESTTQCIPVFPHPTLSHITISSPRQPSPSMCGGHMFISSCSNSRGPCPPILKDRDLGRLGWLLSLLGVLGKAAASTTSEAESSPRML